MGRLPTFLLLIGFASICSGCLFSGRPKISQEEICVREMRAELNDLRHVLSNLAFELELLSGKSERHENSLSHLSSKLQGEKTSEHEELVHQLSKVKKRLHKLEKSGASTLNDLRYLKTSSSEATASLAHYKKKLTEVEGNVDHMHRSVSHIADLFQSPPLPIPPAHQVQNGDTLENIARRYDTTVEALKLTNQLTSDAIEVGQKIRVR